MKKAMLVAFCFLICFIAGAQQRNMASLVGTWEAVRPVNEGGGLQVLDSAHLFLVYGNQKKEIISYKADFTQSPIRFDFTIKDSTETMTLKSLLAFINDDLLKWQLFEGDAQPVHFVSTGGELVYLRRKK